MAGAVLRFFKVAARVVMSVRRVVFPMSSSDPRQAVLWDVYERVRGLGDPSSPATGVPAVPITEKGYDL